MDSYKVKKLKPGDICVSVPGSKSITNRALLLAALSSGYCTLSNAAFCDDTEALMDCLLNLGFEVHADRESGSVTIRGCGGNIPKNNAEINVRSAGTAARFMTAFLAVCGGTYRLNSSEQMMKRPMKDIITCLMDNGVEFEFADQKYHFPFVIKSPGLRNVSLTIDTTASSQYASALMLCAGCAGMEINLTGSRTEGAYIKITASMLEQFGIKFEKGRDTYKFSIQNFGIDKYRIEPDVSAACYFYGIGVINRRRVCVRGVHPGMMQGDMRFLDLMTRYGCLIEDKNEGIVLDATRILELPGIDEDLSDYSDQTITLSVISAFSKNESVIRNIGHIRGQESDRVSVIKSELEKTGCQVEIIEEDGSTDIKITPRSLRGAHIDPHGDHRVAMSFAMMGTAVDDISIENPECCGKTFGNFFEVLDDICE